jgi:hypothetical protein
MIAWTDPRGAELDRLCATEKHPEAWRKCSKCGALKTLSEFYTDNKARDGYSPWCRTCQQQATREWLTAHPGYMRGYQLRNRDRIKRYRHEYYLRKKAAA